MRHETHSPSVVEGRYMSDSHTLPAGAHAREFRLKNFPVGAHRHRGKETDFRGPFLGRKTRSRVIRNLFSCCAWPIGTLHEGDDLFAARRPLPDHGGLKHGRMGVEYRL